MARSRLKVAVVEPCLEKRSNIVRDVLYGCWCGGKRIGGATVPPFEQLRIATILKAEGHDVVFVDAQAEQLDAEEVIERIGGPQLVISSTSVMTVNQDARFIARLKEHNPDLLAAFYGSHATFRAADTLSRGIDFAIQREPERVLRDLTNALAKGDLDGARGVNGVAWRNGSDEVRTNPHYPFIDDLDRIPPVDVSFLPKDIDYFNPIVRRLPYITVSSSHGCPAKCTFCTAPFFHGTKIRMQSAAKVLADMEYYVANGIREVYFRDETFTADYQRIVDICRALDEKKLDVTWLCNSRVDTIDAELAVMMKRAGCHMVKFGVESGDQGVLDAAKKGITLDQTRAAFSACHNAGMDTHAHFMIGMPGDTEETMEKTLQFALEIGPTTATFGICTPYPGTPLFKQVFNRDANIGDGADNADIDHLHTEGEFNRLFCDVDSETLRRTVKRFYRRFYLRPGYLAHSLARIRNGAMVRNAVIGGLNVFSFATSDSSV